MRYAKVCPRCGWENNETAASCEKDSEFLGMTCATLVDDAMASPPPRTAPLEAINITPIPCEEPATTVATGGHVTQRMASMSPVLFLELGTERYQVRSGSTIGQEHPTSAAQIQLPRSIPNASYLHRNHCTIQEKEGYWYVLPIRQPEYTNPTFVNAIQVLPGQSQRLQSGDRLILGMVSLTVRFC